MMTTAYDDNRAVIKAAGENRIAAANDNASSCFIP